MKSKQKQATFFAILAAVLYALNSPISKIILEKIPSTMMASLLYLGAGIGLLIVAFIQKKLGREVTELPFTGKDLPYLIGMVVLDMAAPVLLMIGLKITSAANASLLNNFEIVATSIIALCIFKEAITKRMWISITLVTLSSVILSVNDMSSFQFSCGSLLVILACICWGFENNCTKMLADKNPLRIVLIKGRCSGIGVLVIAISIGERVNNLLYIGFAMVLGFVAYGLSISFYIYAQRELGAVKTSAYYAIAPFIGVIVSWIIFREMPSITFTIALAIMIIGTYYAATDHRK